MKNAIIFDMDGVLSDSELLHQRAEHWAHELMGGINDAHDWSRFAGMSRVAIARELFNEQAEALQFVAMTDGKVLQSIDKGDLEPIAGALEYFHKARSQFSRLGVATSSRRPIYEATLESFGLRTMVDVSLTGDDSSVHKPKPAPYLLAINRLGVSPDETIIIEDSYNGISAAKRAGAFVIGIATANSERDLLKLSDADFVARDYEHLAWAINHIISKK